MHQQINRAAKIDERAIFFVSRIAMRVATDNNRLHAPWFILYIYIKYTLEKNNNRTNTRKFVPKNPKYSFPIYILYTKIIFRKLNSKRRRRLRLQILSP